MGRGIYQTKSEIIYQEIKEDIIDGKYKPKERIVITWASHHSLFANM